MSFRTAMLMLSCIALLFRFFSRFFFLRYFLLLLPVVIYFFLLRPKSRSVVGAIVHNRVQYAKGHQNNLRTPILVNVIHCVSQVDVNILLLPVPSWQQNRCCQWQLFLLCWDDKRRWCVFALISNVQFLIFF